MPLNSWRSDLVATSNLTRLNQQLIAFNLANGGNVQEMAAALRAEAALNAFARRLLKNVTGLRRVLEHLVVDLDAAQAARRLFRILAQLLACEHGRRTLAHAETIDRKLLRKLHVLPKELRCEAIARWLDGALEAAVVAAVYERRARRNPHFAAIMVEQLARAQCRPALFAALARPYDDMRRHHVRFDGDPRWRVIRDAADVDEVGGILKLCLEQPRWRTAYIRSVTEGAAMLVWWRTKSCSALAEIQPTLGGQGRLVQLKGYNNRLPPPADRARICRELEAKGFDCETVAGAPTDFGGLSMLVEMIGVLEGEGARRAASAALRGLRGRVTRRRSVDEMWFLFCGLGEMRRTA
jgi:hypothetical protein